MLWNYLKIKFQCWKGLEFTKFNVVSVMKNMLIKQNGKLRRSSDRITSSIINLKKTSVADDVLNFNNK